MDPAMMPYTPGEQVRILAAVDRKCGLRGAGVAPDGLPRKEMVLLDNIEGEEWSISETLKLLTCLGYIESATWEVMSGIRYYPVAITLEGKKFLSSADQSILEKAEKIFVKALEKWTGAPVADTVDLAKSVWQKVQFERASQ